MLGVTEAALCPSRSAVVQAPPKSTKQRLRGEAQLLGAAGAAAALLSLRGFSAEPPVEHPCLCEHRSCRLSPHCQMLFEAFRDFLFFFFLVLTQLKFSPGAGCSRRAMGSPGCWALGRVLGWGAGGEPYAALISQAWQDDGASCGWGTRGLCTCSP